ncbi:FAD-dependent oxidoreductase [Streptomyces sp. NPDC059637]|uniref:FAD-dependent oxidoreductase n=1 Tax=Streptomyces sp. NPDC059637 TaxID=3347752 RepID=UPI003699E425
MSGTPMTWDAECDVVVVGSGAGALTGACTAALQGLETVVLERTALVGGTSSYSGGACWLPGSRVQEREGVADSTELARTYLRSLLGEGTAERQDAFVDTAPAVVEMLESTPDVEFAWQPFPDYFDAPGRLDLGRSLVARDLPAEQLGELAALVRPPVDLDRAGQGNGPVLSAGRALIGRLLLALHRTGRGEVRTGTDVTELVVDGGRVVGVRAVTADGGTAVRARRGVLLAAGGFERDAAGRRARNVPGSADWSMAPDGSNTGGAIRAATAVGAATELMDQAWWCPVSPQPDGSPSFVLGLRGGLFVGADGRRFANESLPYDRMGRELNADPGNRVPAHFVFDSRYGGRLPAVCVPDLDPQACLESGAWVRADTVPELAELIGVDGRALAGTVEEFNRFAAEGADRAFHRGEDAYDRYFADRRATTPNHCLQPLEQPPYYAARILPGDLGTKGGLRTDADARVLREDGTAIEGLYAAGNTSASLSGAVYPGPGIPLGTAMTFAYRAVRHLASGTAPGA